MEARNALVADLHHRDVLLGSDGSVFLVDLAMAWVLGKRPGWIRRTVFRYLRDQDLVALARMRARFTGGDVATRTSHIFLLDVSDLQDTRGISRELLSPTGEYSVVHDVSSRVNSR